jgi:hypothetical protein
VWICAFDADTIRTEDVYAYYIDGYRTIYTCGICMIRVNGLEKIIDDDFSNHLRMIISVSYNTKLCYYDTIDWDLVSNDLTEHTSDEHITVTFWIDENYRTDIPSIEKHGYGHNFSTDEPKEIKKSVDTLIKKLRKQYPKYKPSKDFIAEEKQRLQDTIDNSLRYYELLQKY